MKNKLNSLIKIDQVLPLKEKKPPIDYTIDNNQCVVNKSLSSLCDANHVGFTTWHLHRRISENKHSVIGKHLVEQTSVLTKCRSMFHCWIFEMVFIKELNLKLNAQKHSIHAKRSKWHSGKMPFCIPYSFTIVSLSHYVTPSLKGIHLHFYCNQLTFFHFWLENDVKRTSKHGRFFLQFISFT